MSMTIHSLDHFVLTVANLDQTCRFYQDVLGMEVRPFQNGRLALHFGQQKINLHLSGHEIEPKARQPTPGSADLCFLVNEPVEQLLEHLTHQGIPLESKVVQRTGAQGAIRSIYLRDPDGNLIELSNPA